MSNSQAGTRSGWSPLLIAITLLAVVVVALVAVAVADQMSKPFAVIVIAAVAGGCVVLAFHGRVPILRWGAAAATAMVVLAFAAWWSSSSPATPEELIKATMLVHDSPLKGPKQPHAARDVTPTGDFCTKPCDRRSEQSDFQATVDEAVADIGGRLRSAGYKATVDRTRGQFLARFIPGPGEPAVIHATKGRVVLTVSIAPSDIGSVVASVAE